MQSAGEQIEGTHHQAISSKRLQNGGYNCSCSILTIVGSAFIQCRAAPSDNQRGGNMIDDTTVL